MALFKRLFGKHADLAAQPLTSGTEYICTDDGTMHVDYVDTLGNPQRLEISGNLAQCVPAHKLTLTSQGTVYIRLFDCIIDGQYYPFRAISQTFTNQEIRCKFIVFGTTYSFSDVAIDGGIYSVTGPKLTATNFAEIKSTMHYLTGDTTITFN